MKSGKTSSESVLEPSGFDTKKSGQPITAVVEFDPAGDSDPNSTTMSATDQFHNRHDQHQHQAQRKPWHSMKLKIPAGYILCSIVISFGGLLFGLDTGCIGPVTTMPQFSSHFGYLSSTVHGLVVSSILIPAAIASFFAGPLADHIGRTKGVTLGGVLFGIGTALEAGSVNLAMLICGRIITGIGEGLFLSPILVYVSEVAPAKERGLLANIQQFLTVLGICVGYFVCYGTVRMAGSSLSWRLPFAMQSLLAFSYAAATFIFVPESPRWLEAQHRSDEAERIWSRLGISRAEREKDEEETMRRGDGVETLAGPSPEILTRVASHAVSMRSTKDKAHALLRVFAKDVRARTFLGVFMSGFQQFSGIDGVLYYAPLLFQQAGLGNSTASFLASGISGLLMMLVTLPAFLLADRWGRRSSTIFGGVALAACMLIIGSLYAANSVHGDYGAARWVVIVLIYVFALTYCFTWAIGVRVHASEIQPMKTKAAATGLSQTSNWGANWIVAFTTPIFLAKSSFGVYFFFGGCIMLATTVCAIAMPETKGKSLEEIDAAFDRRHGGASHGDSMGQLESAARGFFSRVVAKPQLWEEASSPDVRHSSIEEVKM